MKRLFPLLLALALLVGCGAPAASSVSEVTQAPTTSETSEESSVQSLTWQEDTLEDDGYAYVTSGADLPSGASPQGNYLISQATTDDGTAVALTQMDLSGQVLHALEVSLPETDPENQSTYLSLSCFTDSGLWVLMNTYTTLDEDTGETTVESQLEFWNYDGAQVYVLPIEETYGIDPNSDMVSDLAWEPECGLLLVTNNALLFCDNTGTLIQTTETNGDFYAVCQRQDGTYYLQDYYDDTLYAIDWNAHTLGEGLFSLKSSETVCPGGGDYDFFLLSDTQLRGVSLKRATITTLLSWTDWDLAGSVADVAYLDENTYLLSTYSLIAQASQLLTLSRVPADQVPEKTVVRLATGLSADGIEWGQTWTDALDQVVAEAMAQFNQSSDTYRVEVETYSSAEELQLELISGDAPDLIDWNSTAWLEDTPSMGLYAKKGYLVDLDPLFDADPELSTDDLIPSIYALSKERTCGGFYAMPMSYYFTTLRASKEYVGDMTSWTISDMLAVQQSLPEGMSLWGDTQSGALDLFLRESIGEFVDLEAGTCNFETQAFYDLLTLCKNDGPAEYTEGSMPEGILSCEMTLGTLGNFAFDVLAPLEKSGDVLIGYPDAGGSGVSIIFYDEMSICALGQQQEGAWQFLRTLMTYDYQYCSLSTSPVRQDAFDARQAWYMEFNGSCTQEQLQEACELVYNAQHYRTNDSPAVPIVEEEAAAFFAGDKTVEEVARIIQSRVSIYLGEQG
jgi:hypothetical protein